MLAEHMLKISATKNTPEVVLNPDGMFKIIGRSMNANVGEFSKQIDDWIDSYVHNPADLTCVDFYLEYLNTTNFKFYISLLSKIESIKLKDKNILSIGIMKKVMRIFLRRENIFLQLLRFHLIL